MLGRGGGKPGIPVCTLNHGLGTQVPVLILLLALRGRSSLLFSGERSCYPCENLLCKRYVDEPRLY